MIGAVLRHIMWSPFFQLSLAGVGVTPLVVCLARRLRPARMPLKSRRRCRLAVPVGLTFSVLLLIPVFGGPGGSYVMAHPVLAVVVPVVFAVLSSLYVFSPRWGRLVLWTGITVIVVPTVPLWSPPVGPGLFPFREPVLQVENPGFAGGLEEVDRDIDARDTPDTVPTSFLQRKSAGSYPVALVRVGQSPADGLDMAVIPTSGGLNPISGDTDSPFHGAWASAGSISPQELLDVSVDVLVVPPVLWWIPPSGTPLQLQINGRLALERFPRRSMRRRFLEILTDANILSIRTISVTLPERGYTFLQPGTYIVEIRPGSLI